MVNLGSQSLIAARPLPIGYVSGHLIQVIQHGRTDHMFRSPNVAFETLLQPPKNI